MEDAVCEDKVPFISDNEEDEENIVEEPHIDDQLKLQLKPTKARRTVFWKRFVNTLTHGFKIYIRQEVAIVGFSLASLYLTVLGFSGVTSSYFLTQGLRQDLIGVFQGVGAIFGVTGTILYPFLRKKFGTIRTGLFGITTQLSLLLFCVLAISIPSKIVPSQSSHYYSPNCDVYFNRTVTTVNYTCTTLPAPSTSTFSIQPTPTFSINPTTPVERYASPTPVPDLYPCPPDDSGELTEPLSESPEDINGVSVSLYLLITGVVVCRIGLWIYDLAVQQLVQEKVVEEERGVVAGVMNAMISVMDMMHYVLVIAAPRPENFNILVLISFMMVALAWLLYCIYVRKARGHFFHFRDYAKVLKRKLSVPQATVNVE